MLLLAGSWALAACSDTGDDVPSGSDAADGTGYLQVSDLESPPQPDHFTADPVTVVARTAVTSTGCVTVEVDGVERLPVWPTGTTVAQDAADLDVYVVTLPDGTTLTTGDSFEASAVVDDNPAPFAGEPQPPYGKVPGLLDYCAIEALPVAFFDAAAITPLVD